MKKLLLASASVIAIASAAPAQAADLPSRAPAMIAPAPPPFSWTGLYVGAHVGWGTSHFSSQGHASDGDPQTTGTGTANVSGSIFGGQLGYNWQFAPQWILGVEGSISGSGMNGFTNAHDSQIWGKVDRLASVTGRLGWTPWDPRTMLYVKGGGAWAQNEVLFSYALSDTFNRSGWTIGGGFEWAPVIAPNWSFFAEYDYYDFGTKTVPITFTRCECGQSTADVKQTVHTVRVGANYRFNFGR
jgi:outer membrane immunogenic protein